MAVILAPGVCRYTLSGSYLDNEWANIIDMDIETTGSPVSRGEAIWNIAGDILNNWADLIMAGRPPAMTFDEISWVDLDSVDGTTGSRTVTSEYTLPVTGSGTGEPIAGNVAFLVKKELEGGARNARAGRLYLCGLTEAQVNGNELFPSILTSLGGAFETFLTNINDMQEPLSYQADMCVVHTPGISDLPAGAVYNATNTHVSALVLDSKVATQRRRLRD